MNIGRVKPSSEYVYDFTVRGTETFTTFEGIVTHNTMRTYHFAGTAGIQVTLGLPRMLEIYDARKEPRTPTMTIYLKPGLSKEQVRKIAENIKEIKVKDVVMSTVIDMTDLWIKCRLNLEKLKSLEIEPEKFSKSIRLRNTNAMMEGGELTIKTKKSDLRNLRKLKYSLLETHVKGIRGISQVVVTKEETSAGRVEWVISTLGSNLKKVFEIEGVDTTRTMSNNIFEIYDVLGVEAARNAIIRQVQYTLEEQGLGVDIRYIMLLADLMTTTGKIRAIGRYGIAGQKASVLVRAAFEETKKHLTSAAIRGEKDMMKGTVENIMTNQLVPIGTGAFELVGSIPKRGKKTAEEAEESEEAEAEKEE
jgi:DNA-directed RNA polymerase subunit A"